MKSKPHDQQKLTTDQVETVLCANSCDITCAGDASGKVKQFIVEGESHLPGGSKRKKVSTKNLHDAAVKMLQNDRQLAQDLKDISDAQRDPSRKTNHK